MLPREKANESLLSTLTKEHSKHIQENRSYIKTVAEVLLLTATQNISQRGHRETSDADNRGNFLAILNAIGNHDPFVKKKLTGSRNAKYTSHQIQNEILDTLAEMVRSSIINEVKESGVFSIMSDETKDTKKKEQISFVLRYYYQGAVKESFLHFESADQLDAAGLTKKIIELLERYGLDYKNNLVGQSYDGASVMSGKHSGVQACIKDVAKQAFYVHCNAHSLNLVLVDTIKAVPPADTFFALLQRLYVFLSGSHVHIKWLDTQKEMCPGTPRELQRLCDTRWACRHSACHTVLERLPAITCVLEKVAAENHGERSIDARGLLTQIDLQFIGLLVTCTKIFGENLESLESLWKEVVNTAENSNVETEPIPKRKLKQSKMLDGHTVMSSVGERSEQTRDSFRTSIFYPVLDVMLSELKRRFSKPNCAIMMGIQALNPSSASFCKEEALFSFASIYACNIDDLTHEIHQMKRVLQRKVASGIQKPSNIVELTNMIEPFKDVFHELFRLCKIAIAIPVSTASCEHSFSTLKLVKTFLRSTMDDSRLSNLGVLSVESSRAKSLDMENFVNRFSKQDDMKDSVLIFIVDLILR
uniref:DUF4371 domain-containing protein n=1 Tax=Paramormyrops kingsleyae TaxID=1676925 RepID=A0A3B3RJL6_9TELE